MIHESSKCVRILVAAVGLDAERAAGLLSDGDCDVEIVPDVDTALRRLATYELDVLVSVSDLLPTGDGLRLIAEAAQRHPRMRHLLLSSDALRIHTAEAGGAGVDPVEEFGDALRT